MISATSGRLSGILGHMTILGKSIIAILLVGAVGAGAYYATNFMKDDATLASEEQSLKETVQPTDEKEMKADTEVSGKILTEKEMSFTDLVKKGGSYECTVKQVVMGVTTEGKVYIKGGDISAKFSTSVQGKNIETSMVAKDGYSYTWSSMMPGGMKAKINVGNTETNPQTPAAATYAFDGKDIGSYSCVATAVPLSAFDIPSTVTFTEVK